MGAECIKRMAKWRRARYGGRFLWKKFQKEKVYDVLRKFITEAKQCSGNRITLRLLQLLVQLQSYVSDRNPAAFNFMDAKDPIFRVLHHVLNNHSKKLLHDAG